jgi:F-type H+-transporting ATPase subunit gamma
MSSLIDLKKRITSTVSTKKITSAMKMVSVAKLKKSTSDIENVSNYSRHILYILNQINHSTNAREINENNPDEPNLQQANLSIFLNSLNLINSTNITQLQKPQLIIAISPDKGLCGSLNSAIIANLQRYTSSLKQKQKPFIILPIGRKITEHCINKYSEFLLKSFSKTDLKSFNKNLASNFTQDIINLFNLGEISSVSVIYSKFFSTISQRIVCKPLIPFSIISDYKSENNSGFDYTQNLNTSQNLNTFICEPSIEVIVSQLVLERISSAILTFVKNTDASEHAARMIAMDNATKNSEKVIKSLKLEYNRRRQESITSQILEIIGGMESIV